MSHAPRRSEIVPAPDAAIETIVEGEGPAIVMLPSLGRDGYEDFDVVAARLAAAGHRVLRPQPRGIGASAGKMEGVSLRHLAADIAAVIDALGAGRAVVLGHAFGHYVARMTAVEFPARVRGVILAAASAGSNPPEIAAAPRIAGNLSLSEAERRAALRLAFFKPGHDEASWLHGWYPATQRLQIDCRETHGIQRADWWHAGTAPFLELIPDSDPFKAPAQWGDMRAEFGARVTTVIIHNASHAMFPEQPAQVVAAILAWLADLPD